MRLPPLVSLVFLSACSFGLTGAPDDGVWDDPGPDSPAVQDDEGGASTPDDEAGLPTTAVALEGNLYTIDPGTLTVSEPPGLDALFDEVLTRDLLVYVEDESPDGLQLDLALGGANGRQDPCEAVRRFPEGDWSQNPVFDVGPGELATSFGGHPASFRALQLSGVFDEDGEQWSEGVLSAELDTRELAPALAGMGDLCELVDALGGACQACDDGAEACFPLRIEGIVAERVDDAFDPDVDGRTCTD